MKLFSFGEKGLERLGLVDHAGIRRDLSSLIEFESRDWLRPAAIENLRSADHASLPAVPNGARIGPCVPTPSKIIGVGMNYADHAREAGVELPKQPVLFMKPPSTLAGPFDDLRLPPWADQADWEVELALVMGSEARNVPRGEALGCVAGYCVANDLTERGLIKASGQLLDGKGLDGFTPLGPWLVTTDEIADPQDLALTLSLNGTVQQNGTTATMIFPLDDIISHVSRRMTLLPGDVILTGTPPGIGMRKQPPRYLRDGDLMVLGVAGLGEQRQRVGLDQRA